MGESSCGRKAERESGVKAALAAFTIDCSGDLLENSCFGAENEVELWITALAACLAMACALPAVTATEPAELGGASFASICFRAAFSRICAVNNLRLLSSVVAAFALRAERELDVKSLVAEKVLAAKDVGFETGLLCKDEKEYLGAWGVSNDFFDFFHDMEVTVDFAVI